MDFGAKRNIARELAKRNCEVTIYPAYTSAEEIMADAPDGVMLSNGPGDPKDCMPIVAEVKNSLMQIYRCLVSVSAISF